MATARTNQDEGGQPEITVVEGLGKRFDDLQERIRERAYHLFLQGGDRDPDADWLAAEHELVAPVDLKVKEHKKTIQVEAMLQDFSPEEIEVELQGNTLRVFGSHRESSPVEEDATDDAQGSTTSCVSFYRALTLPAAVDTEDASAKLLKNGKLKITLPRRTPLK